MAILQKLTCLALLLMLPTPLLAEEPKPAAEGKLVPLNKNQTVLLDVTNKKVLLKSKVVLRQGTLEMLACLSQTKEHESILAVDAKAYVIHTGLLAIGATPGQTVRFDPEFTPPKGQTIEVYLNWKDEKGNDQRVKAQEWIRHATLRYYSEPLEKLPADLTIPKTSELYHDARVKELSWYGIMTASQRDDLLKLSKDEQYQKAIKSFFDRSQIHGMDMKWVFAGSQLDRDDEGNRLYRAEQGDVICVANFPSAMIDVAGESSATGETNLLFEAWTERIPPMDTPVTIELIPVFKEKEKPAENESEKTEPVKEKPEQTQPADPNPSATKPVEEE